MPFRQVRIAFAAAAALAAIAASAPAAAQDAAAAAEAVKMRQGVMTAVKWHFAPFGALVKGERPFDTDLLSRAQNLSALARIAAEGFVVPSGPDIVPASRSKADIWQDTRAFDVLMRQFATESERLFIAAQTRDAQQIRTQFMAVSDTCRTCHDKYRVE